MTEDKPKLELVKEQLDQLDEEEREFARLRRDVPGVKGAAAAGLLTISVGRQPVPKNEFYRTHPDFRPAFAMTAVEVGLDKHYVAIDPNMVETVKSLGISCSDHTLYLIITPRGALRIIPIGGANDEGVMNTWAETKERALLDGIGGWVRMYSDKEAAAYRSYPAPLGRFGEPTWPEFKQSKIFNLAFRDRGRLISSSEHPLIQKWAGRDRDK